MSVAGYQQPTGVGQTMGRLGAAQRAGTDHGLLEMSSALWIALTSCPHVPGTLVYVGKYCALEASVCLSLDSC